VQETPQLDFPVTCLPEVIHPVYSPPRRTFNHRTDRLVNLRPEEKAE